MAGAGALGFSGLCWPRCWPPFPRPCWACFGSGWGGGASAVRSESSGVPVIFLLCWNICLACVKNKTTPYWYHKTRMYKEVIPLKRTQILRRMTLLTLASVLAA